MKHSNLLGVIFIVISIIFIGIGRTEKFNEWRTKIIKVFSPLQWTTTLFFNVSKTRKENEILKTKLVKLSMENQLLKKYKYENESLRNLLNFSKEKNYEIIAAKIIGRETEPFPSVCIINKGSKEGIKKGMQVITPEGVYGKIVYVEDRIAKIQTIFDYNFRLSCMNLRTGVQGIAQWGEGSFLMLKYIPIGADIKIGDEIITSGLGDVFIKGLRVGKVKKISTDETSLTYRILLQPACKIEKVEMVFVIKEKREREVLEKETNLWKIKNRGEGLISEETGEQ